MKRFVARILAAFMMAALAATAGVLVNGRSARADQPPCVVHQPNADHPQYLFLAPTNHGNGQFVPAQTYAYGWFGVSSKPHAVFHWDYYDHRWIWW